MYLDKKKIALDRTFERAGVLYRQSTDYFFHCKKCDNDWFINELSDREAALFVLYELFQQSDVFTEDGDYQLLQSK